MTSEKDLVMMTGDTDNPANGDRITAAGRRFLVSWTAGLLLILLVFGWLTVSAQRRNRLASVELQQAVMNSEATEKGVTPPDFSLPPGANPAQVQVGFYVDRIAELSVKDASWTVDFYVWFRWRGNAVQPGNGFQVIDGWIESRECPTVLGRSSFFELMSCVHFLAIRTLFSSAPAMSLRRFRHNVK